MTRKGKLLLIGFLVIAGPLAAWATNDTIGVTAGSGKIANLLKFGSGNVISETGICDATTENQCAAVNASGQLSVNIAAGLNSNGQATMANSAPVVIASNQSSVPVTPLSTTNAGATLVKGGVGVVNGGTFYQAVAASQTATVLQSSTGATGDYISHCKIYPTSTSPGVVTVFDNTNTAANSVVLFPGGSSSLSNLATIVEVVGAISRNGAWKVTTGANVSVVCFGSFS